MPFGWLTLKRLRKALSRIPEFERKFHTESANSIIERIMRKITYLEATVKALSEKINAEPEIPEELKQVWRKREEERLRMEYSR